MSLSAEELEDLKSDFYSNLVELTTPDVPVIEGLTDIAKEYKDVAASTISELIEKRIREADENEVLPSLYLLDSISKNVKKPYIELFSQNLASLFVSSYERISNPRTRASMLKLLKFWPQIFPPELIWKIEQKMRARYRVHQDLYPKIGSKFADKIYVNPEFFSLPKTSHSLMPNVNDMKQSMVRKETMNGHKQPSKENHPYPSTSGRPQHPQLHQHSGPPTHSTQPPPMPLHHQPPFHGVNPQQGPSMIPGLQQPPMGFPQHPPGVPQQPPPYSSMGQFGMPPYGPQYGGQYHPVSDYGMQPPSYGLYPGHPQGFGLPFSGPSQQPPPGMFLPTQTSDITSILNTIEMGSTKTSKAHEQSIRQLYEDFKLKCNLCGLRFYIQKALDAHLDDHSQRSLESKRTLARSWFQDEENWDNEIQSNPLEIPTTFNKQVENVGIKRTFDEANDKVENEPNDSVPEDANQEHCPICNEPFTKYFDQNEQEWMYKNARRDLDTHSNTYNQIVHSSCFQFKVSTPDHPNKRKRFNEELFS